MNEEKLVVKIMADISDMKKNMNEAGKEVGGFKSKVSAMASKVGGGLKVAAGAVAGVATAAVAGTAALFGAAKSSADYGDRVDKLSKKLGFTAQGFQEWDYILSQNGTTMEAMQGGMKTLTNKFDDLAQGGKVATDAFGRIGLSFDDLKGKTQEEIFESTIKGLQGIEDPAERAALANELLGRSGQELAPLLESGTASIDELKAAAHEMGIVMSEEGVAAGAAFTDSMDNLKRSFGGVMQGIGLELMPMFQQFMDWVVANMPMIKEVIGTVFSAIGAFVTNTANIFKDYLLPVIMTVVEWFKANLPSMKDSAGNAFEGIKNVWNTVLKPTLDAIMSIVKVVWNVFKAAFPAIKTIVKVAFDVIKTIWNSVLKPVFDLIIKIVKVIADKFMEHMPEIQRIFTKMADMLKSRWENTLKPAFEALGKIVSWLADMFTKYILPIVGWIMDWFVKIAGYMIDNMSKAQDFVQGAIEGIKGFFSGIGAIVSKVLGFFGDIYNGIKDKMGAAKDKVSESIEKIKGFFKFKFKWPKLKMPKFSFSGTMNPLKWATQGVPKIGVTWNARGAIFKKPTVLANGQGVGDASNGQGSSPEVVAPLSDLKQMLGLNGGQGDTTINLNGDYNFRDKEDMDYFMNKLALATRRK